MVNDEVQHAMSLCLQCDQVCSNRFIMALGPHNLLFTEYQGFFPCGKVAGS